MFTSTPTGLWQKVDTGVLFLLGSPFPSTLARVPTSFRSGKGGPSIPFIYYSPYKGTLN